MTMTINYQKLMREYDRQTRVYSSPSRESEIIDALLERAVLMEFMDLTENKTENKPELKKERDMRGELR